MEKGRENQIQYGRKRKTCREKTRKISQQSPFKRNLNDFALALAREGYRWRDIHVGELFRTLTFSGFWKFAARHWRTGWSEVHRSLSKKLFARSLSRLVPGIEARDLVPAPSGVRAQVMNGEGDLVHDFLFKKGPNALHVLNSPSPAATSCLAIGEEIAKNYLTLNA